MGLANGVPVVEPSQYAKEETQSDEQEDQRRLLSAPCVMCVDEGKRDGEEVEETGAKGVCEGCEKNGWIGEEKDQRPEDGRTRSCRRSPEGQIWTVRADGRDGALEEHGRVRFADKVHQHTHDGHDDAGEVEGPAPVACTSDTYHFLQFGMENFNR